MEDKKMRFYIFLVIMLIILGLIACDKNPTMIEYMKDISNDESDIKVIIPQSITTEIYAFVNEKAPDSDQLLIRYYLVDGEGIEEETYHVTYFTKNLKMEQRILKYNPSQNKCYFIDDLLLLKKIQDNIKKYKIYFLENLKKIN